MKIETERQSFKVAIQHRMTVGEWIKLRFYVEDVDAAEEAGDVAALPLAIEALVVALYQLRNTNGLPPPMPVYNNETDNHWHISTDKPYSGLCEMPLDYGRRYQPAFRQPTCPKCIERWTAMQTQKGDT